ncbi:transglutaminaseTgpA domain-containing protein [Nonomuraea sp. NPDC059007]|uniref:transglutaminaseTgpA domain-containing protein n=1 Tax=Nonomuraea sp. NPDC059007 TaxID=3346692 RepID=UPI0036880516
MTTSPESAEAAGSASPRLGRPVAFTMGGCLLAFVVGLLPVVAFAGAFGRTSAEALTDPRYLPPTVGAALAVAVTCLVTALATWLQPVTRLTAGVVVLAAYLAVVIPSNVLSGPHRLLTSISPLEPHGAELATVALLAGLAALAAAEPILRGRSVAWALPVALLGTAAGLSVSAGAGAAAWLGPGAALIIAVLLLFGAWSRRDGSRRGEPARRRPRFALVAATVILVATGSATSLFLPQALPPASRPMDARDLLPQPVEPRQAASPLSQFPALHAGRTRVRLTVTTDRPVTHLRYATLSAFDGIYWTTSGTFWRAGTRLPGPDTAGRVVKDEVHVAEAGDLGLLVSSGRPARVSVAGLGVDPDTGDLVSPADRPLPRDYVVHSLVPAVDPAALAADTPIVKPERDAAAGQFADAAKKITGDGSGYEALRRLADHFAKGVYTEHTGPRPPSGHGNWHIRRLMAETRTGTAEQYASAFAVLARSLGYDVRVVVGFRPGKGRKNQYRITERDVDAWAEVRFTQAGWVAFDPTPRKESKGRAERSPDEEFPPPADDDQQKRDPARDASADPLPPNPDTPIWPWLLLALSGLLMTVPVAVPMLKWFARGRRRRTADPQRRVAAAWREMLAGYADAGLLLSTATTTGEAARLAAIRFPDAAQATGDLAGLVNEAMYAAADVSHAEGERAWALADEARAQARTALSFRRKVAAALRPRWGPLPISRRPARF